MYLHHTEDVLRGRLIFARHYNTFHPDFPGRNTAIYSYDLITKKLSKVIDLGSPGRLHVALDGSLFCVSSRTYNWIPRSGFFLYSPITGEQRMVQLPWSPEKIIPINGHIFVMGYNNDGRSELQMYDVAERTLSPFALPGASRWKFDGYSLLQARFEDPGSVFFRYQRPGEKTGAGKDYERGDYRYSIETREFEKVDRFRGYISASGKRVLVKRPGDEVVKIVAEAMRMGEKQNPSLEDDARETRVLAEFRGDYYSVPQLSPCRRFALVCTTEQYTKEKGMFACDALYYICNLENGKASLFLENRSDRYSDFTVGHVFWILGEQSQE